jgi:hypothetical protein
VLLRGGHGHDGVHGPDGDGDWRTFCERIGWQSADGALPEDYEDRLAARVFGEAGEDWPAAAPTCLEEVAASEPARRGTSAPSKARSAGVGTTVMAIAAAFCAAASVTFWVTARSPEGAPACPDIAAASRAIDAPADLPTPLDPNEAHPEPKPTAHPPRTNDDNAPPSEMKVRRPKPPGSFVAQRSRNDEVRRRAASHPEHALPGAAVGGVAGDGVMKPQMAVHESSEPRSRLIPSALPLAMGGDAALPEADASHLFAGRAARPISFDRPAEYASASWSLSPGNRRWFGASLPPSTAPLGVPAGFGVMAQVDVAKAFGGL